jgi:hypothetical protein
MKPIMIIALAALAIAAQSPAFAATDSRTTQAANAGRDGGEFYQSARNGSEYDHVASRGDGSESTRVADAGNGSESAHIA